MKKRNIIILLFVAVILISWGKYGHKKINFNSILSFNNAIAQFMSWSSGLEAHASDADDRKYANPPDPTEAPKHYIDIDNYPTFTLLNRIPQTWDSIVSQYGITAVKENGILPWATINSFDTLVKCFHRSDFTKALLIASDLGHYIADGHMPLHITKNFDGQLTGNSGIHSRYESTMINANISQIVYLGDTNLNVIENVNQYVFDYIYYNYKYKDSVLLADNYAKSIAGGITTSSVYTQALWDKTKNFTITLFKEASHKLAELIYTAWVKSQTPLEISDFEVSNTVSFEQNSPNPFQNSTVFRFHSNKNMQHIVFTIKDISGKTVATLIDNNINAGSHVVEWAPTNLPKGIYFSVLQNGNSTITKKILYF